MIRRRLTMEKWDAYTKDGRLAHKTLIRGEAIPDGLYHLVCEVLVRHVDGSFLLMKRSMAKPNYPGFYEATAGGSALMGEDKIQCITRELKEETGITCNDFLEVNYHISEESHCHFYSFVCTLDCQKNSIQLQENETEGYKWLSEKEFIEFVNSDEMIPEQKKRYYNYFVKMEYVP